MKEEVGEGETKEDAIDSVLLVNYPRDVKGGEGRWFSVCFLEKRNISGARADSIGVKAARDGGLEEMLCGH